MEQLEFFEIPSPCRGICQSNERGLCLGCFRSRDERFLWQKFNNAQRSHVIRLSKQRRYRWYKKHHLKPSEDIESLPNQSELPF
ncbi:DUF1289 domain-containing protein [Alginatibacterium sediminis]|uniref:DUF1289 domain-containing protein n=1 Tax=Alginatibacterium sediminis TaxID=2164068 RepID=UPI0018F28DDE|nr:DUF1289 domain-containing protein [Alginatibacterium sediminis]